jgi:phytoene synthase
VRFLLTWADALYASGERGIRFLPWRAALAVRTARLVYADIGRVILERDADPFAARAVVSKSRKVALGILALSRTLLESRPDRRRAELTSIIGASDVLCL